MNLETDFVALGRVIRVHGLKGDIVIESYCHEPKDISAYGAVRCAGQEITLHNLRDQHKKGLAGRLLAKVTSKIDNQPKNLTHIDQVQFLVAHEIFVPRALLPEEQGSYLWDYLGYNVFSNQKNALGQIIGFTDFGAGDLMVCEWNGKQEFYLFRLDLLDINHEEKIITLHYELGQ